MFPQESLHGLFQLALPHGHELADVESKAWQAEFYEFFALEAIDAFHKVKYDPSLSPQILREGSPPSSPCLCLDIEIQTADRYFLGRLGFSTEMRRSLRQKYTPRTINYPPGLSEAITVPVLLIAGQTTLSRTEWNAIEPGDFLILDSCTITPGEDKGRILVEVNGAPLFRGKIKDGNIKILEYPQLQEVNSPMEKDEDFEEDFETESDENTLSGEDEFTEEEFEEEESLAEEEVEEGPLPSPKPQPSSKAAAVASAAPAPPPMMKPEDIPLTISVEVGRLQMSIKQLMELAPGNLLELNVDPESGVDLVVNGKCIGKGELLKIGDLLGVRILDCARR